MEIVTIDNSGRLVIPEFLRKKLHLTKNVPLLITELDDDKILIKKLDRDEIEKRLREELKGLDIDGIAPKVRDEVNVVAKKNMRQFLVDANVFIAAIKNPGKKTRTLDLILELISNQGIYLVGNDLLLLEFEKYAGKFKSETASYLLKRLRDKMREVELDENYIKA